MRTIGSYEAKTHLPRLLDEVAQGETITITKKGKPVARLVPADNPEDRRREIEAAWTEWVRYREQHNITLGPGLTIKQLIEEGRRY
jgi:prevent-host-death family protein